MTKYTFFGIPFTMLVIFCSPARGDLIDFNSAPTVTLLNNQSVTTQGFTFTETANSTGFAVVGIPCPACVQDGSATLSSFNDGFITMTQNGGASFDLLSFFSAVTEPGSVINAAGVSVVGTLAGGGTVTTQFLFSNPNSFTKFDLPNTFVGLASIEFHGIQGNPLHFNSREFQLDNIAVNAVPEVSSIVLLLTTCTLLFGVHRVARIWTTGSTRLAAANTSAS